MGNDELFEISEDQVNYLKSLGVKDPASLLPLAFAKSESGDPITDIDDPVIRALLEAPFATQVIRAEDVMRRLDEVVGKKNWTAFVHADGVAGNVVYVCNLKILGVEKSFTGPCPLTALIATASLFGVGRYLNCKTSAEVLGSTIAPYTDAVKNAIQTANELAAQCTPAEPPVEEKTEEAAPPEAETKKTRSRAKKDDKPAEEQPKAAPADEPPVSSAPPSDDDDFDPFAESAVESNDVIPEGAKEDTRKPDDSVVDEVTGKMGPGETPAEKTAATSGGANQCVFCSRIVPGNRIKECAELGIPPLHPKCVADWEASQK